MQTTGLVRNLPSGLHNKIFYYLEHPIAKIIKDSFWTDEDDDCRKILNEGLKCVHPPKFMQCLLSPGHVLYTRYHIY